MPVGPALFRSGLGPNALRASHEGLMLPELKRLYPWCEGARISSDVLEPEEHCMSLIRTAVIAAAMLAAASPALAFQYVIPESGAGNMSPVGLWGQQLTAVAGAHATRAQWKRAVRAASLINSNRCKDAYLLAVDERDETLAKRVYEVCTAPSS